MDDQPGYLGDPPVEWRIEPGLTDYPAAVAAMEARVAAIRDDGAPELVWLVEHPPLYTAGTSADPKDLLQPDRFPVYRTGRGGEYTYHGPGQRVVYVMLDLKRRGPDLRRFVQNLEEWIIRSLAAFAVDGQRREGRVGIWVERPSSKAGDPLHGSREDKIAAIGVRVRRWVTYHGIAINVEPDLGHFSGIVPCGIAEHGVTSLVDLGLPVGLPDLDAALRASFTGVFGPARWVETETAERRSA
ncbi:MAG: lipoyl(octanoyl) transferase LipB [Kiloniellaceae bacterium]